MRLPWVWDAPDGRRLGALAGGISGKERKGIRATVQQDFTHGKQLCRLGSAEKAKQGPFQGGGKFGETVLEGNDSLVHFAKKGEMSNRLGGRAGKVRERKLKYPNQHAANTGYERGRDRNTGHLARSTRRRGGVAATKQNTGDTCEGGGQERRVGQGKHR